MPSAANDGNVAVEEGSISDPVWVEDMLKRHHVDDVFLCLTGTDELLVTLNFFDVMQPAGSVKYLLYLSACSDFTSDHTLPVVLKHHSAMSVLVKPIVELKLKHGGYPWTTTVLGPALFFDNDLRSKDYMLTKGIFDEPLGPTGVSRVSTEDNAVAARNTLLQPKRWAGKKVMID